MLKHAKGFVVALVLVGVVVTVTTLYQDHVALHGLVAASADDKTADGKERSVADRALEDHRALHALVVREQRRIQAEQQQQQLIAGPRPPNVTTPVTPPVASSPVPEPKK
jgi:hypothetical protein